MAPWWLRGAVAGFLATLVMTLAMLPFTSGQQEATSILWERITGVPGESPAGQAAGLFLHFLYGTIAGVIFLAFPWDMFGRPQLFWLGIFWGIALYAVSLSFWMPVLGLANEVLANPAFLALFGLFHLVYGGVLGGILQFWARAEEERRGERARGARRA